jgi:hypothetical protein
MADIFLFHNAAIKGLYRSLLSCNSKQEDFSARKETE